MHGGGRFKTNQDRHSCTSQPRIYIMVSHCYNCMVVKKKINKNITYFILIIFRVLHLLYDT